MKFKRCEIPVHLRFVVAGTCLGFFAGCATTPQQISGPQYAPAANVVRQARSSQVPAETRVADYLQAAAMTAPLLGNGTEPTPGRDTYDAAAAELTILLSGWGSIVESSADRNQRQRYLSPASSTCFL
jgi:hypothetical protein